MGFWWFLLACDLIIPLIMIISGRMMWKNAPNNINGIYGYRTTRSMKNMDTWKFAHDYCGRLWWKMGWILFVLSLIAHIPFYGASDNAVAILAGILCTVQVVALLASIIPTEMALKKNFDDEGKRRENRQISPTENKS